jgi:hypothetical protein
MMIAYLLAALAANVMVPRHIAKPVVQRRSVGLVVFSGALAGSVHIRAYTEFLSVLARDAVVLDAGRTPPTIDDVGRMEAALNVDFAHITALSHSSGVEVARMVSCADRLVCIDPVDAASARGGDLDRISRAFPAPDEAFLAAEGPPLDPALTLLSNSEQAPYAFSELSVRVREMDFFEIFNEGERMRLSGRRSTDDSRAVRAWLAGAILAQPRAGRSRRGSRL